MFYRVLLQTRLEAVLGRWPAITATALLFAASAPADPVLVIWFTVRP
ncbi:hypothetical protein [Plantactinospora sp. CA-290183]